MNSLAHKFGFPKSKSAPVLPAIKAMWDKEEAFTLEQRRARYKVKDKFVTPKDIIRWESYEVTSADRSFDTKAPASAKPAASKFYNKTFDVKEPNIYSKWKEDAELNNKVALWQGNIISLEFDAVLNAANNSMTGGGGIDGAIHSAAGDQLYEECKLHNGCETGQSKITRGYRLPAKYVIATVGPVGESAPDLHSAYYNSLELAKKHKIRTFALCGVSTGVYGYPLMAATRMALATVRSWLEKNKDHVDLILFCTFLAKEVSCYETLMPLYFPRSSVLPRRPFVPQNPSLNENEGEIENEDNTVDKIEGESQQENQEAVKIENSEKNKVDNKENTAEVKETTDEKSDATKAETEKVSKEEDKEKEETAEVKSEETQKPKEQETEKEKEEEKEKERNEDVQQLADALSKTSI